MLVCPSPSAADVSTADAVSTVLQGRTAGEWKEAYSAAVLLGRRGSTLEEQMGHDSCMLVMEYVPGRPLLRLEEPFTAKRACTTASELGRSTLCHATRLAVYEASPGP